MAQAGTGSSGDAAGSERWVLVATIVASSMAFIDGSALNVALPSLQESFNANGSDVFWVISAYNLFLAALILVGGSLGDHYGRRRIFRIGIMLFSAASLICGLAPSISFLIAARAVQGIGGALMVPGSLAILSAAFAPERRGTAIGTWSTFSTITTIAGPVLGGWLASQGLWRAVFLINLPLAVVALVALQRVPESRDEAMTSDLDLPGVVLATLGLAGVTFGFIQGPERGFSDPLILGTLVGGFAALVAFVLVERRSAHPMVPLRLFRSRTFSGTNALTLFLYAALTGAMFFLTLNMIQVQGYPEALAGQASLPFVFMLILMSRWAGGLIARIGPRIPLTIGPALVGVGFFLFGLVGLTNGPADYWTTFFPGMLVVGIGMGLTVAPLTTAVMGSAPSGSTGTASGINNTVARTAAVLAIAIFGALALVYFPGMIATRSASIEMPESAREVLMTTEVPKLGEAAPPVGLSDAMTADVDMALRLAFVDTSRLVMWIAAGMAWLSALLAWLMVENRLTTPDDAPAAATAT